MKYFNGFSLRGEELLFTPFLERSDLTMAGFSYGAQVAFERAYNSQERIEKLILLSPAFFQREKRSFVRAQLHYFDQNRDDYLKNFLDRVAHPANIDLSKYLQNAKKDDLELLLRYQWEETKIRELLDRGTQIEVFLGGRDKIINSDHAFSFFSNLTQTYLIKDAGHLLLSS